VAEGRKEKGGGASISYGSIARHKWKQTDCPTFRWIALSRCKSKKIRPLSRANAYVMREKDARVPSIAAMVIAMMNE
jgi:hypothetical protein